MQRTAVQLIYGLRRNERVKECKEVLLDLDKAGMKLGIKVNPLPLFFFPPSLSFPSHFFSIPTLFHPSFFKS